MTSKAKTQSRKPRTRKPSTGATASSSAPSTAQILNVESTLLPERSAPTIEGAAKEMQRQIIKKEREIKGMLKELADEKTDLRSMQKELRKLLIEGLPLFAQAGAQS